MSYYLLHTNTNPQEAQARASATEQTVSGRFDEYNADVDGGRWATTIHHRQKKRQMFQSNDTKTLNLTKGFD